MIRLLVIFITFSFHASATEPLLDHLSSLGETGVFYPRECCWVGIPKNERVKEIRRSDEGCSAIGGPVGIFERVEDLLFLTELDSCGGKYRLNEVYGSVDARIFADWVSGVHIGKFQFLCAKPSGQYVFKTVKTYTIENGVFVSTSIENHSKSDCEYE